MTNLVRLVAVMLLFALAACGDESGGSSEVAGSTVDASADSTTTVEQREPDGPAAEEAPGDSSRPEADDPSALTEADAIATIERYFYGPYDLEACELLTPRFLRRSYGNIDGCVLGAGQLATKITITPGELSATEATGFEVDAEGGVYSGEKVTVDLVAGDDGWLISDLSVDVPVGP